MVGLVPLTLGLSHLLFADDLYLPINFSSNNVELLPSVDITGLWFNTSLSVVLSTKQVDLVPDASGKMHATLIVCVACEELQFRIRQHFVRKHLEQSTISSGYLKQIVRLHRNPSFSSAFRSRVVSNEFHQCG